MASREDPRALEIVDFWLSAGEARWFTRDEAFDAACAERLAQRDLARSGGLQHWSETAAGSFALIVLLDQIPRNALRGTPEQFATDALALAAAEAAVDASHDRAFPWPAKNIVFLPFQHAEILAAQERSLDLYRERARGQQDAYYWALVHHDAVRRFGRFPHRNAILGRATTAAEQVYLETGGFAN